jgi:hypothetical protein
MDQDRKDRTRDKNERGHGTERERHRTDSGPSRRSNSGGISNRPLDRERSEQEQVPERGEAQPDR